ncbi:PspC domain-containing protein [uncultured Prevotella sp.]|uniref:PspC domain-containing protein n=1 Tax=uncultured Prevotella sp. TaxID=159272 RepID=UPI0027E3AA17|nr:PspC domain-containing protein [uncultured Prevotella sp.]
MNKKLQRSSTDCMLGGVCGGLANYFDFDPTLVRVAYVLLSVCTAFSGVLAYILLMIIMPKEQEA